MPNDFTIAASPVPRRDPFTLGVASGDPWPQSVVLWTRLVASADDPHDTGIDQRPHEVEWQVGNEADLADIEPAGTVLSSPEHGHALHVVVCGLRPGCDYWYPFRCGRWLSPIGRAKTAPHRGLAVGRLDVAAASCQSWGAGYYTAHRHLAEDWPDLVVFLGDYLYERAIDERACGRRFVTPLPAHLTTETHEDFAALCESLPQQRPYILVIDNVDRYDNGELSGAYERIAKSENSRLVGSLDVRNLSGYTQNLVLSEIRREPTLLVLNPESAMDVMQHTGVRPQLRPGFKMTAGRGILVENRQPIRIQVATGTA